ncbi:hypothetical protein BDW67DRAFT_152097 [Aspergillus spinulosporus]
MLRNHLNRRTLQINEGDAGPLTFACLITRRGIRVIQLSQKKGRHYKNSHQGHLVYARGKPKGFPNWRRTAIGNLAPLTDGHSSSCSTRFLPRHMPESARPGTRKQLNGQVKPLSPNCPVVPKFFTAGGSRFGYAFPTAAWA